MMSERAYRFAFWAAAAVIYADCRDEETAARRVVTLKQALLVARVEHVEKARKAAPQ